MAIGSKFGSSELHQQASAGRALDSGRTFTDAERAEAEKGLKLFDKGKIILQEYVALARQLNDILNNFIQLKRRPSAEDIALLMEFFDQKLLRQQQKDGQEKIADAIHVRNIARNVLQLELTSDKDIKELQHELFSAQRNAESILTKLNELEKEVEHADKPVTANENVIRHLNTGLTFLEGQFEAVRLLALKQKDAQTAEQAKA